MRTKILFRPIAIAAICGLLFLWMVVTTVWSSPASTSYPLTPFQLTMWPQGVSNWCGPGVLQSAIQWVNTYYDGTPTPEPTIVTKANLWAFMKNNTCSTLGGRDRALPGTVGDGAAQVRKLNIAYDVGVDPHAMAWTMYKYTPAGYNYHYWIYSNGADEATRKLLYTLEMYHEPVSVAINHGFHWVLVIGYDAEASALHGAGNIEMIYAFDPLVNLVQGYTYQEWISSIFTPYTHELDPDPSTGWYVPPPDHWKNHWVTIERDARPENPDWGMSLNGPIRPNQPSIYLPFVNFSEAVR